ncbi:MAG TPA: type II secretion system F family protein [Candidatus Didemnitutus sp.]|nr:type II secretion system F family protein [Candidatus Didemnitutus sp.]
MSDYDYTAYDTSGRQATGQLTASDEKDAGRQLSARRLYPVRIQLVPPGRPRNGQRPVRGRARRIRPRDLAVFVRQLATLLRAGLPLVRALDTLSRQERDAARRALMVGLASDIRAGLPLSEAVSSRPGVFDRMQINLIRAGEAAGALGAVLDRLATFAEKSLALRRKLQAALIYPACILIVAAGILIALLVFVIPRFKQIFADLLKGAPLPALTRAVLSLSEAVRHHAIALGVFALGAVLVIRVLGQTVRGRHWRDAAILRVPWLGDLLLKSLVAQSSRTLATLLTSGVPVLSSLAIARDACGNTQVSRALESVRESVAGGSALAAPLENSGVFPPVVTSIVDVGEQTGQLPEMLGRVAEIFEGEVETAVAGLGAALEPLLIVTLALIVGTIVLALFLPILRIVQLLS